MELEVLKDIGLSEKEIQVYVGTLGIGIGTTSEIAEKIKLPRTTTYSLLKTLKDKGFISYVIKFGVKYFNAVSPKDILEKVKERERKLKELIPSLENLQKIQIKKAKVEFYEGVGGFKTVANDMLNEPLKEYYVFLAEKNLHFLPHFHPQYRRRRREKGIKVKVITEKTKLTEEFKRKDKQELRQTRFIDETMKNSVTSLFIYGEKIAYIMATENQQLGIMIKDKTLADLQRKIFEKMWKIAKS